MPFGNSREIGKPVEHHATRKTVVEAAARPVLDAGPQLVEAKGPSAQTEQCAAHRAGEAQEIEDLEAPALVDTLALEGISSVDNGGILDQIRR